MKIYVIERDNPQFTPEPEVVLDGNEALRTVKAEYDDQLKTLGITQFDIDKGLGGYGCWWCFEYNGSPVGSASIESDYDSDEWKWRITEHEI